MGLLNSMRSDASLAAERQLLTSGIVLGIDEVGRGALAGPAMVGAVAVELDSSADIAGLKDSKVLTSKQRESLVPLIRQWCVASAIGSVSAAEIDEWGIVPALQLATTRALEQIPVHADLFILDGSSDWLSALVSSESRVHNEPRADGRFATVAAASVLAKVERDRLMIALHEQHPVYGWNSNKGYGSSLHMTALGDYGPSRFHRLSWRLPSTGEPGS